MVSGRDGVELWLKMVGILVVVSKIDGSTDVCCFSSRLISCQFLGPWNRHFAGFFKVWTAPPWWRCWSTTPTPRCRRRSWWGTWRWRPSTSSKTWLRWCEARMKPDGCGQLCKGHNSEKKVPNWETHTFQLNGRTTFFWGCFLFSFFWPFWRSLPLKKWPDLFIRQTGPLWPIFFPVGQVHDLPEANLRRLLTGHLLKKR